MRIESLPLEQIGAFVACLRRFSDDPESTLGCLVGGFLGGAFGAKRITATF